MSGRKGKGKRKEKHKDKRKDDSKAKELEEPGGHYVDIRIHIMGAHGLRSRKDNEPPSTFCKYTFPSGERTVETPVVHNNHDPDYDHEEVHENVLIDEEFISTLVASPLTIAVHEAGDKKHGSVQLGGLMLDWSVLLGGTFFRCPLPLFMDEDDYDEVPELEIAVTLSEPLMTNEEWEQCNILTVSVDGVYSLPKKWMWLSEEPIEDNPYSYTMTANMYGNASGDDDDDAERNKLLFEDGMLSFPPPPPSDFDNKQHSVGVLLPDELAEKRKQERYTEVEVNEQRIHWQQQETIFLKQSDLQRFIELCKSPSPNFLFEFRRSLSARADPNGTTEDPNASKYLAQVSTSLAGLMRPGETTVSGRCPFVSTRPPETADPEHKESKKRRAKSPTVREDKKKAKDKKSETKKKKKDDKKKDSKSSKKKTSRGDKALAPYLEVEEDDGDPYAKPATYAIVSVLVARPLVPVPAEPKAERYVADYIPPRPKSERPRRAKLVQDAQVELQEELTNILQSLLEEYKLMFMVELVDGSFSLSKEARQDRRKKFIYELNSGGQYFTFKEKLKMSIVRVVREKFGHTSPFESRAEFHAFLNTLYEDLTSTMHKTINDKFFAVHAITKPVIVRDVATLQRLAIEAEVSNLDFGQAMKYYGERLTRDPNNTGFWFDYAAFCLRTGYEEDASEFLREAIELDEPAHPCYVQALLAHGVMCADNDRLEEAETFLKEAAHLSDSDPVPWNMLALFYGMMENEETDAERAATARVLEIVDEEQRIAAAEQERQAKALESSMRDGEVTAPSEKSSSRMGSRAEDRSSRTDEQSSTTGCGDGVWGKNMSAYVRTARFLLDLHLGNMAAHAIAQELSQSSDVRSPTPTICAGEKFMQDELYEKAIDLLTEAIATLTDAISSLPTPSPHGTERELRMLCSHAHVLVGHMHFFPFEELDAALQSYNAALAVSQEDPHTKDLTAVYLRLGAVNLINDRFEEAKGFYLKACRRSPSCFTWLGAGVACYRLEQYEEAEDALSEGNLLDPHESDIWAYLCLICLYKNKLTEADQAFTQCKKLRLKNHEVLREIAVAYTTVQRYRDAEHCLQESIKHALERQANDVPHTRRLLGDLYILMKQPQNAKLEFTNVFQHGESEDRIHALTALIELSPSIDETDRIPIYQQHLDAEHEFEQQEGGEEDAAQEQERSH